MVGKVLKENQTACMVLIDHEFPAFKRRVEARFEREGLKGRILFLPYQELSNGDLHEALAVMDLYLDTQGFNSHTAAHDALWANGVLVTVRGETLASRVAADLLHCFGMAEYIFDSADAAVEKVNQLLQNSKLLQEAREKADECRSKSKMYDNFFRAQKVIEALQSAYHEKLSCMQQEEDSESLDVETDMHCVIDFMENLCIQVTESPTISQHVTMIPATFRDVLVVVKIANKLNPQPHENVVFRKVLGRDGKPAEYGPQGWPQLLPLVETTIDDSPMQELDVIHFKIRGRTAFAVLEGKETCLAIRIFDDFGERWKSKPSEYAVN